MNKYFLFSQTVTAMILATIVIFGVSEVIQNHQKYGYSYTTQIVINDIMVETIVTLPMNLFLFSFFGWITILLISPVISHIIQQKQKNVCGEKNELVL